jgi:hypothetical protein
VSIGLAISITQDPRFHFEPDEGGSLLTDCPPNSTRSRKRLTGWVAEWSKAVVLKSTPAAQVANREQPVYAVFPGVKRTSLSNDATPIKHPFLALNTP